MFTGVVLYMYIYSTSFLFQKRHQSLPASDAGFLSPMPGRSHTPTPQEPHSNISSPSPSSASLVTSPAPPRSRSRQRKLLEIDEEDQQHGSSSGDSDQIRRRVTNQGSRPRMPDVISQQGQNQQRSHSPRVRERDGKRERRESRKRSSKKIAAGKSPVDVRSLPEGNKAISQGFRSDGDIFERGYDDEPVDTSSSVSSTSAANRPTSPRPPTKANNNRTCNSGQQNPPSETSHWTECDRLEDKEKEHSRRGDSTHSHE